MKSMLTLMAAVAGSLAVSAAAVAHHSFAAVFDGSREIDVTGIVTEFRFVNPHATMSMEVIDADGASRTLIVEFDGQLNLVHSGWTEETIGAGERVTVHGNPARSGGERIWFLGLTREDGSQLIRPALERLDAIEEQRRLRREQRERENQSRQ